MSKSLETISSMAENSERSVGSDTPKESLARMRVMVVDDDRCTLEILSLMLRECNYTVTTCSQPTTALSILRENKGAFDIVLTERHMHDMDGIELLRLIVSEMDLPVVMMSADSKPESVLSGVQNGACDYLIKPLQMRALRFLWQHVVRKNLQVKNRHSYNLDESKENRQMTHGTNDVISVDDSSNSGSNFQRKKHTAKDDVVDLETGDSSSRKKRMMWSRELHQKFDKAINKLGLANATPQKICELMNVPGLTRDHVSSRLQKYRLKRGSAWQPAVIPDPFFGIPPHARVDFMARRTNFPSLDLSLYSKHLVQPSGSLPVPGMHQLASQKASSQGPNNISAGRGTSLIQTQLNIQTNISMSFPESNIPMHSSVSTYPTNNLGTVSCMGSLGEEMIHQGSTRPLAESGNTNNTRPYLAFSSQASNSFMSQSSISMNQKSTFSPYQFSDNAIDGGNAYIMNHSSMLLAPQSQSIIQGNDNQLAPCPNNVPYNTEQHLDEGTTDIGVLNRSTNWTVHTNDFNAQQPSDTQDTGFEDQLFDLVNANLPFFFPDIFDEETQPFS